MKESNPKVFVVDFDQTLFLHTFWTRFFFRISKIFHILALLSERLNQGLAREIRGQKVIILTGRNLDWEKQMVARKLKKGQVEYQEMILCPRAKLTMEWKEQELQKIRKAYGPFFWMDDMKPVVENDDVSGSSQSG